MIDINKKLNTLIDKYDNSKHQFSEEELADKIIVLKNDIPKDSIMTTELLADGIAFSFCEDYNNKQSGWGYYYGPLFVFNDNGITKEFPSLSQITNDVIQYWAKRSITCKNHILKARYADLVWEFSKLIDKKREINTAHNVIDSIIQIALNNLLKHPIKIITKLKRAFSIALAINDKDRVKKLTETIINYEEKIGEDKKLGLWGFSFDILMMNNKIKLTENQTQKILLEIESRLLRVSNFNKPDAFDPFAAEAAALRLAHFYKTKSKSDDIKRVLLIYSKSFIDGVKDVSALIKTSWLQKINSTFITYGLKGEAKEIEKLIQNNSKNNVSELKTITYEHKIDSKEINQFIKKLTSGTFEEAIYKISNYFIPIKSEEEKMSDLVKKHPLNYIFSSQIIDDFGRTITSINSIDEDFEGHLVRHVLQSITFQTIFLNEALKATFLKHDISADSLTEFCLKSPIFNANKKLIIFQALKLYFSKDYISMIHLLIPQIEEALRRLLLLSGECILKLSDKSGYDYILLTQILKNDIIKKVFDENFVFYLNIVLNDKRGLNLRNDVCHGLIPADKITISEANRILHILLCLANVRQKEPAK